MKHITLLSSMVSFLAMTSFITACDDGGTAAVCGNAQREAGEDCDGADLADATCADRGFVSGELACAADCTFDTAACSSTACGNDVLEDGEDCEPGLALTAICAELGFETGELACAADCTFDTAACVVPLTCGDGEVDGWEDCEENDPAGTTCESLGFASGAIACTDGCLLDTAGCVSEDLCGNGVVDPGEFCDGAAPDGMTCESIGYPNGGTLACATNCTLDVVACDSWCTETQWGSPCDPETSVCCAEDNRPVECIRLGSWGDACWWTCEEQFECGLNSECIHSIGNDTGFCFATPQCFSPFGTCTAADGSLGYCTIGGIAKEASQYCGVNGHRRQGQSCDPTIRGSQLVYDLNDICYEGWCLADPQDPQRGVCANYCDTKRIFAGIIEDTCPDHYNCLNTSEIFRDYWAYEDGYRLVDIGQCYPSSDGVDPVFTRAHAACHLLTNLQTRSGRPCDDGTACLPFKDGSLQGVCRPVSTSPKAPGESCDPASEISECDNAAACVMADPFRETNLETPATACRRFCDATVFENNDRCAELANGPFVCLTTSRFYTSSHELPTSYNGVETQPSLQGYCVPPR
ncbi:hypothetical protein KJ975_07190 [Myxococcota bacterium]|nr:hypothetical protein [Myxococcota bacterium]